jgi:hypothetical protein
VIEANSDKAPLLAYKANPDPPRPQLCSEKDRACDQSVICLQRLAIVDPAFILRSALLLILPTQLSKELTQCISDTSRSGIVVSMNSN